MKLELYILFFYLGILKDLSTCFFLPPISKGWKKQNFLAA